MLNLSIESIHAQTCYTSAWTSWACDVTWYVN